MNSKLMAPSTSRLFIISAVFLVELQGSKVWAAGDANTSEPLATVRSYIDAFNKADEESMLAKFAVQGFILDGMPPHVWQGPNAAREWFRDGQAMAKKQKVTEEKIVISGEPLHNQVSGTSAYVVVPASFTYKMNGKLVSQSGAYFTVALTQVSGAWRIASWAWTKGTTDGTPAF